jgi:hypothetical protein
MPQPFVVRVELSEGQRQQLESLVRAGSTPQALAHRVRLVLRTADPDEPSNVQIAGEFSCARKTVARWRLRFLDQGLAGLQDAPRSGRPRSFSPLATSPGHRAGIRAA